ncbi:MAG: type II toxin-antitoxin system RelE/ParE family toxin [Parachlamydiaceae bacterium]|nr:type II toxin-antitoxin system RelE/ParE family toxin [Parachlamydiaceae bacterium]
MVDRYLHYIGSSDRDLKKLPEDVKGVFATGFRLALKGEKHPKAKPFIMNAITNVFEIVENDRAGTYRAVYTVKFEKAVYVLHVFQKKSKTGKQTTQQDKDLIKSRFKWAESDYKEKYGGK